MYRLHLSNTPPQAAITAISEAKTGLNPSWVDLVWGFAQEIQTPHAQRPGIEPRLALGWAHNLLKLDLPIEPKGQQAACRCTACTFPTPPLKRTPPLFLEAWTGLNPSWVDLIWGFAQ